MSTSEPLKKKGKKRQEPDPKTTTGEKEAPPLRQLIPDGDVILVVGPDKIKIQLSSHLLRSTSPVFAAMLGPNFKEGSLLRGSQGPIEIALPEDNANALWNIYSVLYGGHPRTQGLLTNEIYDIAFLAHKYDLVERLALAREGWFRGVDTDPFVLAEDNFKMLVAAYWLESEFGFAHVSRALVKERGESIYKLAMESRDQVLGLKLCFAIEELRMHEAVREDIWDTGLCLGCFDNPGTERFWVPRDDCESSYDWVLP